MAHLVRLCGRAPWIRVGRNVRSRSRVAWQSESWGDSADERCRLGSAVGIRSYVRFTRTNPSGCSAVVAHLLWEPFPRERCRLRAPKRGFSERNASIIVRLEAFGDVHMSVRPAGFSLRRRTSSEGNVCEILSPLARRSD
jgi:hypothetical protein